MLQSTLGTALKGSEGGMGSWGKKSELCVAGENLLELERTKGGEGGGNGYGRGPYSYWNTKNSK